MIYCILIILYWGVAFVYSLWQAFYWIDIYEHNGIKIGVESYKTPPRTCPWKLDRGLRVFLSCMSGWIFLWILLIDITDSFTRFDFQYLYLADLVLLWLTTLGLRNRLFEVAESIGEMVKAIPKIIEKMIK